MIGDLEGQLRNSIVAVLTDHFAESNIPFLDMAANQIELGAAVADKLRPMFADLGLALEGFQIQNISLPEELQKRLDERIGMGVVGDMGRYTQFQTAQSIPVAARQRGRRGRRRRRARRGHRDGPGDGAGDEPGGDAARRRRAARGARRLRGAGAARRAGRARGGRVRALRQAGAAGLTVLSRLRRRAGVDLPALQRAPGQAQQVLSRLRSAAGLTRTQLACPSCAAPVGFASAQSLLAVCGYCRATLIRRDLDVEQVGTMAALLEDATPLQLAAEGAWRATPLRRSWAGCRCAGRTGAGTSGTACSTTAGPAGSARRPASTRSRSRPPSPSRCPRGRASRSARASRSVASPTR